MTSSFVGNSLLRRLPYLDNLYVQKLREEEYKILSTAALLLEKPLLLYREDIHSVVESSQYRLTFVKKGKKRRSEPLPHTTSSGTLKTKRKSTYDLLQTSSKLPLWCFDRHASAGLLLFFLDHLPMDVIMFTESGLRVHRTTKRMVLVEGFAPICIPLLEEEEEDPDVVEDKIADSRYQGDSYSYFLAKTISDAVAPEPVKPFTLEELTENPVPLSQSWQRRFYLNEMERSEYLGFQGQEKTKGKGKESAEDGLSSVERVNAQTVYSSVHRLSQRESSMRKLTTLLSVMDMMPSELGGYLRPLNFDKYGNELLGCEKSRNLRFSFYTPCECGLCVEARRKLHKTLPPYVEPDGETVMESRELGLTSFKLTEEEKAILLEEEMTQLSASDETHIELDSDGDDDVDQIEQEDELQETLSSDTGIADVMGLFYEEPPVQSSDNDDDGYDSEEEGPHVLKSKAISEAIVSSEEELLQSMNKQHVKRVCLLS